jgi:NADH-quinone oxidoreductase subunit L
VTATIMLDKVWLLPAIMLASFLAILFFGKRSPGKGHAIGIAAVGVCCALALVTAGEWVTRDTGHDEVTALSDVDSACSPAVAKLGAGEGHSDGSGEHAMAADGTLGVAAPAAPSAEGGEGEHFTRPVVRCVSWWHSGDTNITVGTQVDGIVVMMLVVVTLISLLVHIFSTDYVHGDRRYTHYFAFLSLFTASMLFFVMSQSTIQMIVGWELVGVCSFVLIGHWWEEKPNSDAAMKAFLTNRVGDIGLLVGMTVLFWASGKTFSIMDINIAATRGAISQTAMTVVSLSLLAAVMSKSGQFILHTWLPDAMAGPTPVSALIHAATMVVAGIFMVARLYPVFFEGLSIAGGSINMLALVGSVTAVLGALLAFVQKDIKKVLAYSTVSQLGFMVAALGVGAWTAAMFHLFTHAFFKGCLFLCAGSLSHACHHSFNMVDDMGGLRKVMPKTFWAFVISAASLAGIFPLAGFWSKDEILAGTGGVNSGVGSYQIVLVALIIGAVCTAGYMTRAIWYVFFGEYRGHGEPHESGPRITIPLMILATLAVVAGFVNLPEKIFVELPSWLSLRFEHAVEPVGLYFPNESTDFTHAAFNPALAGTALALALLSAALVWSFYTGRLKALQGLAGRNKAAGLGKRILENKYYLDWLYTDIIVGFVKGPLAGAANWVNQHVIDAVVNGAGSNAAKAGEFVYHRIDQNVVDGAVNGAGIAAGATGGGLSKMQTGKVQQYGVLMFAGAAILTGILVAVLTT